MRQDGSDRPQTAPLSAALALIALAAGIGAMHAAATLIRIPGLGLRSLLLLSELALAAPALVFLWLSHVPRGALLGGSGLSGRQAFLSIAAGGALWVLSLGLFELQYVFWRPPRGYLEAFRFLHERLRPTGPVDALVSLVAIAVAPALCEELLFRGVVLPALVRPLGAIHASLASAALFGLIHVDKTIYGEWSLYRVPFAFAVGLGFAALRLRTRGLLQPALAHTALNALTFAIAPLADDPASGLPEPRPLLGAALFALGLTLTLLSLRAPRFFARRSETPT